MEIIATIKGTQYRAELPDSIRQLSEQFPLEETFQKSGEHELFCRLGRGIKVRGMDGTSGIHRNGIYYFADFKLKVYPHFIGTLKVPKIIVY